MAPKKSSIKGFGCNTAFGWMNDWAKKIARKGAVVTGTTNLLYALPGKFIVSSDGGISEVENPWSTANGIQ